MSVSPTRPNAPHIFHLCPRNDWLEAVDGADQCYHGSAATRRDGFLHASTEAQVVVSADKHCRNIPDLVMLVIKTAGVEPILRWEVSRDQALFPHLYGPVPIEAVVSVVPLPKKMDGSHDFSAVQWEAFR